MKRIYFGDISNLAAFMINEVDKNHSVSAVFHYQDACELLRELLKYDDVKPNFIQLEPEDWDGYDKEYSVDLNDFGTLELSVEPVYDRKKERYLYYYCDCLILGSDVNSTITKFNDAESCDTFEAVFETDEEIGCSDCDYCVCCHDCDAHDEEDDEQTLTISKDDLETWICLTELFKDLI